MSQPSLPSRYDDIESLERRLHTEPEKDWQQQGARRAIELFHQMAENVPAYKDFLKSRKFAASSVNNIDDFKNIPPVDKDNYLRKYPKEMLCWGGKFGEGQWVISTTSGSTGQPYYFPRQSLQDRQYAVSAELYLRANFQIQNRKTLYVVAFPMGAWIGGLFTYEALKIIAGKGYDMSVITPGIHKQEIINAVKQLGKSFDQVIIGIYAPFLKDILDEGIDQGLNWADYNMGFVFSAEAFTDNLRDYVIKTARVADPLRGTLNHYGTVDLGTMAHETAESVLIRRQLVESSQLGAVFPESRRQPTLCQYDPNLFYFESDDYNLFCSAYSGLPLVRYDLKDQGGVIARDELHRELNVLGIDVDKLAVQGGISDITWNLPFVYVYERKDFSVSYYAAQVYPDTIRRALETSEQAGKITGKFAMSVNYDKTGRQRFKIRVELKRGVTESPELAEQLRVRVHQALEQESSEYRNTARTEPDFGAEVELKSYEDPTYFKPGGKQRWVAK